MRLNIVGNILYFVNCVVLLFLYSFSSTTCSLSPHQMFIGCLVNNFKYQKVKLLITISENLDFTEDLPGVTESVKKPPNKQGDKSKENTRKIFSGPKRVSKALSMICIICLLLEGSVLYFFHLEITDKHGN